MIAFCIKPDDERQAKYYKEAYEDLQSLVTEQRPAGEFVAHDDPSRLLNALQRLVEMEKCVLSREGQDIGQLESEKRRELDLPAMGKPVPHTIRIMEGENSKASAEIEVEGGEFIKIYLDATAPGGKPRLVFRPRGEKLGEESLLPDHAWVNDDQSRRYYVKADKGTMDGNLATFHVSIQNADEAQFTYRPKSIWAEIIPMPPNGTAKTPYTFYDLSFQNGSSFPIQEFRAAGWPKEATAAKIHLWLKFRPTDPDENLALDDHRWKNVGAWKEFDLHPQGEPPEKPLTLKWKIEGKEGDPSCTVVVEQSVPAGIDPHAYRIEVKPPENSLASGPDEIHCRSLLVTGQPGKVIHRFVFNVQPSDIGSYRICITSQKNIKSDACHPQELEVHVD